MLYVLIAIAATLAYRDVGGPRRRLVLGLFAANLALIALVRPHNRAAALALAPYGAWVLFNWDQSILADAAAEYDIELAHQIIRPQIAAQQPDD